MATKKQSLVTLKKPLRSDRTRARILEAAREAFATLGYERATVRTIAEMAKIHPSMVMRYYQSKEGLFTASSHFDLKLPDLSKAAPGKAGEFIVKTFMDRWENLGPAGDLPALLRLSVTHPEGRDKAIAIFTEQVKPALGKVSHSKDRSRAAALVATQLVGIAFLRYVLKMPSVVALEQQEIIDHAGQTIQRYLEG